MTKTQAREYLKRAREGIKDAEAALKANDAAALYDALMEISGAAGTIETDLTDCYGEGNGVAGLLVDQWGAAVTPKEGT